MYIRYNVYPPKYGMNRHNSAVSFLRIFVFTVGCLFVKTRQGTRKHPTVSHQKRKYIQIMSQFFETIDGLCNWNYLLKSYGNVSNQGYIFDTSKKLITVFWFSIHFVQSIYDIKLHFVELHFNNVALIN